MDQNITFKKRDFFNSSKVGIWSSSIMFYDSRELSNFFIVKSHTLCSQLFTDYVLCIVWGVIPTIPENHLFEFSGSSCQLVSMWR